MSTLMHYDPTDGGGPAECNYLGLGWRTTADIHAVNCERCIRTASYHNAAAKAHTEQALKVERLEAEWQIEKAMLALLDATRTQSAQNWCDWKSVAKARRDYLYEEGLANTRLSEIGAL